MGTPSAPAKCAVELLTVTNTSKFFKILMRLLKSLNKSTLSKLKILFPLSLNVLISLILSPYCKLKNTLSWLYSFIKSFNSNDFKLPNILNTLFHDMPIFFFYH